MTDLNIVWRQDDHSTTIDTVPAAADGTFEIEFEIPNDARTGKAVLAIRNAELELTVIG